MSSPSKYIAERLWLTRARAMAGAFGIALLIVFIWPNAHLVTGTGHRHRNSGINWRDSLGADILVEGAG